MAPHASDTLILDTATLTHEERARLIMATYASEPFELPRPYGDSIMDAPLFDRDDVDRLQHALDRVTVAIVVLVVVIVAIQLGRLLIGGGA